jgi:hypothetical protein
MTDFLHFVLGSPPVYSFQNPNIHSVEVLSTPYSASRFMSLCRHGSIEVILQEMNGGDGKYFAKMHSVRRSGNTFNSGKRIFLDCIMKTQELIIGCCGETGVRPAFIPDCYFHTWELAGRNFFFFLERT